MTSGKDVIFWERTPSQKEVTQRGVSLAKTWKQQTQGTSCTLETDGGAQHVFLEDLKGFSVVLRCGGSFVWKRKTINFSQ